MPTARPVKLIVYPAGDIDAAKALFGKFLGVDPYADSPYYVGYRIGDQEVGLDPNGKHSGPISYIDVDDIKAELKTLLGAGATMHQEPKDVGGGLLIAQIKEPGGNILGLRQK